jgi:transketolase N-terminal domain/subunit
MGNAHAGLALYVILEKYYGYDAEQILIKHGIHATRDLGYNIFCSGGSLGQAETIAVGAALANMEKNVWLLSSDGSMQEGASIEALLIKSEYKLENLKWFISANGYAAYRVMNTDRLEKMINSIDTSVEIIRTYNLGIPFLNGLDAHYYKMKKEDWEWVETNKQK